MKKKIGILSAISLLVSGGTAVHAQVIPLDVTTEQAIVAPVPFWENASSILVDLQFTNGKGTLSTSVIGITGTTNINGSVVLERLNANGTYSRVTSWDNLRATGNIFLWGTDYYVARGHTYRMTVTATVIRNGISETISLSNTAVAD